MLNHITIMGRLTRDPELRRTASGVAVANFTLAVDRDFASKDGGEKETDFIDCVAWRQAGEFVAKYFTKGRMAVVSGRLEMRNGTDKEGNKRRSAEVVADNIYFADSKKDDNKQGSAPQGAANDPQNGGNYGGYGAPAAGGYGAPATGGYGAPAAGAYGAPAAGGSTAPAGGYHAPAGGFGGYAPLPNDEGQMPF